MRDTELAWAAGFIDGEGTIGRQYAKGKTYGRKLAVPQKHRECLDRLQAALGCGTVYTSNRPIFTYQLCRRADVDHVLQVLWPYLSIYKRQQALNVGFVPA